MEMPTMEKTPQLTTNIHKLQP